MLLSETADPRLSGVSITDVTVDRELTLAHVYFSALEGEERSREILEGFQHAQGYFRRELSRRIALRVFPRLSFHWDPTFERAEKIERLIASLHESSVDADGAVQDERSD